VTEVHAPSETWQLCEQLFQKHLRHNPLSIVLLSGEPGAGKTTFCRGFAAVMGIDQNINSPTFNLQNTYRGSRGCLKHCDLYRIADLHAVEELGLANSWSEIEYAPTVVAIEWGEKAFPLMPDAPVYRVVITVHNDESRDIRIEKRSSNGTFDPCN